MGLDDKIKAATDKVTGKAKESAGEATDDQELKAEGQGDQAKGHLRDAVENVKDTFKK